MILLFICLWFMMARPLSIMVHDNFRQLRTANTAGKLFAFINAFCLVVMGVVMAMVAGSIL